MWFTVSSAGPQDKNILVQSLKHVMISSILYSNISAYDTSLWY